MVPCSCIRTELLEVLFRSVDPCPLKEGSFESDISVMHLLASDVFEAHLCLLPNEPPRIAGA